MSAEQILTENYTKSVLHTREKFLVKTQTRFQHQSCESSRRNIGARGRACHFCNTFIMTRHSEQNLR
jgi:hypothetical protein